MYNVGQADNLLSPGTGSVSMPSYKNGSISLDQYPCRNKKIDLYRRPEQIKTDINDLGNYVDAYNMTYPDKENYEENTQHKQAGDIEDKHLFLIMLVLLIVGGLLVFINMKYVRN